MEQSAAQHVKHDVGGRPLALFVSDVHLQENMPSTAEAFLGFLREKTAGVPTLYLLGDLFEYWAGDDDLDAPFHRKVTSALREVSDTGTSLRWIAGNRDFLAGTRFADAAGLALLPDPHTIEIAGRRIILTHGDACCTDDLAYMEFRHQVRNPEWQRQFLDMPLSQRKQIIEGMREGSRNAQRDKSYEIMDVNVQAIEALFASSGAEIMIHGHTHRPAMHEHGSKIRYVLPDWDCENGNRRGGWLEINADGSLIAATV